LTTGADQKVFFDLDREYLRETIKCELFEDFLGGVGRDAMIQILQDSHNGASHESHVSI